jgi:hypothetical protein
LGASADNFELRGTSLQTFENFGCYSCTKPYMVITGEQVTIKNTMFKLVNGFCFYGASCANTDDPVGPMMQLNIKKPYTNTGGILST